MRPLDATFKQRLSKSERDEAIGRAAVIEELHEVEHRAQMLELQLAQPNKIVGADRERVTARCEVWRARAQEIVERLWPLPAEAETEEESK